MRRNARGLGPTVAIVVVAAGVAGLALVVWLSPHRGALEAFGSFAVAIAVPAAGLIVYLVRIRQPSDLARRRSVDDVADVLAEAVKDQWARAAADRWLLQAEPIPVRWKKSSQPVAGPVSAAVGSRQFSPLPGLAAVRRGQLREGGLGDLHAVYGGLGSGRMVIAGAPGSGKSGAAVLLILAALRHREQVPAKDRPLVPVPVIFTMHGWDPSSERAGDWLAARLGQTYPLLAGAGGTAGAVELLGAGRIAVILDGLDEIPAELRSVALRALSQQAVFRVVVLTRSAEMAATARESFLEGAVALELQDVDPSAAAGYLTRVQRDPPPRGWRELTGRLRLAPGSPLAKALSNPLTLTLVRDTYRDADVGELLRFCDAAGAGLFREDVEDYLLDRVLPTAYAARLGEAPPRYELRLAHRALSYLATRMNQDGTRDLAWWRIPAWTSRVPRIILGGLVAGLAFGLLITAPAAMVVPLGSSLADNLSLVFGIGLVAGLVGGRGARGSGSPGRMAALRWRQLFSRASLITGLAAGFGGWLVFGLLAGLALGLTGALRFGLELGLAAGLIFGLVAWLAAGLEAAGGSPARITLLRLRQLFSPSSLMTGLVAGLTVGLVNSLRLGLGYGFGLRRMLLFGVVDGLTSGIAIWLVFGLGTVLSTGLTQPEATDTSPLTPLASWRRDRTTSLVSGLTGGLVTGLLLGLGFGLSLRNGYSLWTNLEAGLGVFLVIGFLAGLMFALTRTETWAASLAFAQLAWRQHTPARLMHLLEDARERQVLRTVGPIYQFRHARLQDRLADQATTATCLEPKTSQAAR